jgi:hypothetical protein
MLSQGKMDITINVKRSRIYEPEKDTGVGSGSCCSVYRL